MKLVLLHGPAIEISRQRLSDIKKGVNPNNVAVLEKSSPQEVKIMLSSMPLIAQPRLVVFENISEETELENLTDENLTVVFWYNCELSPSSKILKKIKELGGQILFFPEGKELTIFPFLDALAEKKRSAFVELAKLKKGGFDEQYIITMVLYLLRSLTVTAKNAPDFVRKKNERQRRNFPQTRLFYKFVLETDFKIKSGLLDPELATFLLVSQFTGLAAAG